MFRHSDRAADGKRLKFVLVSADPLSFAQPWTMAALSAFDDLDGTEPHLATVFLRRSVTPCVFGVLIAPGDIDRSKSGVIQGISLPRRI
jgi:hypothetical protein